VLGRLLAHLSELGVLDADVITRPHWAQSVADAVQSAPMAVAVRVSRVPSEDLATIAEIAAVASGRLVLMAADILTSREGLAGLLADPRIVSGILSTARSDVAFPTVPTRADRGRVLSAGSPYHAVHDANGWFLEVIKVDRRDREALVRAARELALLTADPPPRWREQFDRSRRSGSPERSEPVPQDVLPLVLVGLIRSGVHAGSSYLRGLPWARPRTEAEAAAGLEAMSRCDEDRMLLDSAVKGRDGFFTTFLVSPYSKYLARWAARHGWTPNGVTTLSLAIGIAAAGCFAVGNRAGLVAGAILLQAAFTADCVDGQLARYTRRFSKLGAWLDSMFDRGKEYVVYAGLALGASRGFGDDVWVLAAAALTLQTARHMIDFGYAVSQHDVLDSVPLLPLDQADDRVRDVRPGREPVTAAAGPGVGAAGVSSAQAGAVAVAARTAVPPGRRPAAAVHGVARAGMTASDLLQARPWMRWCKKILVLPIGERFALISVTAAVSTPRTTFVALLAWGSVAMLYGTTGKILRSVAE